MQYFADDHLRLPRQPKDLTRAEDSLYRAGARADGSPSCRANASLGMRIGNGSKIQTLHEKMLREIKL